MSEWTVGYHFFGAYKKMVKDRLISERHTTTREENSLFFDDEDWLTEDEDWEDDEWEDDDDDW